MIKVAAIRSIDPHPDDPDKIVVALEGEDGAVYGMAITRVLARALGVQMLGQAAPLGARAPTPRTDLSAIEVVAAVPLAADDHSPPVLAFDLATGGQVGFLLPGDALKQAADSIAVLQEQRTLRDPKAPVH